MHGLTCVTKIAFGEMNNNASLLRDTTGRPLLIDAPPSRRWLLDDRRLHAVVKIVTTHQHADHWRRRCSAALKAADGRRHRWRTARSRPCSAPFAVPTISSRTAERSRFVTTPTAALTQLVGHNSSVDRLPLTYNAVPSLRAAPFHRVTACSPRRGKHAEGLRRGSARCTPVVPQGRKISSNRLPARPRV